jgi:hypothetical protein
MSNMPSAKDRIPRVEREAVEQILQQRPPGDAGQDERNPPHLTCIANPGPIRFQGVGSV